MHEIDWQFEHSVECKADRPFAWSYWTNVSNWELVEGKSVEWIKLDGPFQTGTSGSTKMPGHEPHFWKIGQVEPERAATIEMALEGAVFYNRVSMKSIQPEQIRITQHLSLAGPEASKYLEGMQIFETSAPQGLAKMAKMIASAYSQR